MGHNLVNHISTLALKHKSNFLKLETSKIRP